MADLFTNLSALGVFLSIASVGFIFLIVSTIAGGALDHSVHLGGDVDGGHGFLDSRAISVFVASFGGCGAVGVQLGLSVTISSLVGLAGGLLLGGAVSLFGRFLYSQQASSTVSVAQLVGRTAQVIVTIPAGGVGQVSCRVGEERIERIARARDPLELKSGTLVRIDEIAGDSVIVTPLEGYRTSA